MHGGLPSPEICCVVFAGAVGAILYFLCGICRIVFHPGKSGRDPQAISNGCSALHLPKIHKINQAVDLVAKYHSDRRLIYFVCFRRVQCIRVEKLKMDPQKPKLENQISKENL